MSTNGNHATPTQTGAEPHAVPNGIKLPIYMDNHATTPMDPAGSRRNAALLHGEVRQSPPAAITRLDGSRKKRSNCRANESPS